MRLVLSTHLKASKDQHQPQTKSSRIYFTFTSQPLSNAAYGNDNDDESKLKASKAYEKTKA
jgi:hypothetical protein